MSRDPSMDFQWQNLLGTRNYVSKQVLIRKAEHIGCVFPLGGKSKEKIFF